MFGPLRYGVLKDQASDASSSTEQPERSIRAVYVKVASLETGIFVLRRRRAMSQAQKDAASRQPQGQKAADAAKASGGNGIDVFASVLGSGDLEKGEDAGGPSFYKQINRAYHHHTWQYW